MKVQNPNDIREIVKDNAHLYRESEDARQNKEDMSHFLAQNPQSPTVERIIENIAL
jgi:regulator of sirC expression with transglutaminase-like and TPR domain